MNVRLAGRRAMPDVVAPVVAALLGAAVYVGSLRNGFAYDDVPLVLGDPRLRGAVHLGAIFGKPYWSGTGAMRLRLYRPLTTLSLAVDHAVAGFSPVWFHLENVLWYILCCALVAVLLRRFFPPAAALIGAAVFALHPVHVEAVANVAGRSELLAAALLFAACITWLRDDGADRPSWPAALGTAVLFACALLAKESAVMLPALLVLLDFAAGRWQARLESIRNYARACATRWIALLVPLLGYVLLRASVVGLAAPEANPAMEVVHGPVPHLLTALEAWPVYARLLFFPRTLLANYGPRIIMPAAAPTPGAILGAVVLIAVVLGGIAALRAGRRRTTLALLWFPIAVFPVSNLVVSVGVLVAERTLFVPSFALAVGAAGLVLWGATLTSPWRRRALAGAVALVCLGFAVRTITRVPDWRSTNSIFQALLRDRPDSFRAHWYLGRLDRKRGDLRDADRELTRAVLLWPWHENLVLEATATAMSAGDTHGAADLARIATRAQPSNVVAWRLLAVCTLQLGDTTASRIAVRRGLALSADDTLLRQMNAALQPGHPGPGHEPRRDQRP